MRSSCVVALLLVLAAPAYAATMTLSPEQDNTIFEDNTSFSNGAGDFMFVGRACCVGTDALRRALVQFDIAGSIPAGSTIHSATLTLQMSRTTVTATDVTLHRALAAWGEGTSHASGQEGMGTSAVNPDATWDDRMFPSTSWSSPGGDFAVAASATQSVDGLGSYTWTSLAADVQDMLDNPGNDFGWFVIGEEPGAGSASTKRFNTRENGTSPPELFVDFTPPGGPDIAAVPMLPPWAAVLLALTLMLAAAVRLPRRAGGKP